MNIILRCSIFISNVRCTLERQKSIISIKYQVIHICCDACSGYKNQLLIIQSEIYLIYINKIVICIFSDMNISNGEEAERQIRDISFVNHLESERKLDRFDVVYGRELQSPILGDRYQLPDLPTCYVPSTTLDTSLLHIPVYAHLKVYDLKPVRLPEIPSILSALHLQFSSEDTAPSKSSREISSTIRISEEDRVSTFRDSTKSAHQK